MKSIVFMGTPEFSRVVLSSLVDRFDILALFCQPDRPFGRKKELKPPETKSYLQDIRPDIPVFQPEKFCDEDALKVEEFKADFIVVVAYGQILPRSILKQNCLNIHASLLPKYRGASPIQEMILRGEKFFGISIMRMNENLDSGDILGMSFVRNDRKISLSDLSFNLAKMGARLLEKILLSSDVKAFSQNHAMASFCTKIKKNQGLVDFHDAQVLVSKSRAYDKWPGIFLDSGVKIFGVSLESGDDCSGAFMDSLALGDLSPQIGSSIRGGEILKVEDHDVIVACKKGGCVRISHIQDPGRSKMSAYTYIQGKRLGIGERLA